MDCTNLKQEKHVILVLCVLDLTADGEVFRCNHAWDIWDSGRRKQLNKYQQNAITRAYRSEFVMIQGPPGNFHDSLAMMKSFYIFVSLFTVYVHNLIFLSVHLQLHKVSIHKVNAEKNVKFPSLLQV